MEYDAVTPKDSYDLVAIGSSELLRSWDSNRADELLGIHTFNMGSSSTILEAGVYITFKNIMAYQNPKRVLIMVNRYSMTGEKIEHQTIINTINRIDATYFFPLKLCIHKPSN